MSTYLRVLIEVTDGDDLFVDSLRGRNVVVEHIEDSCIAKVLEVDYVAPESVGDGKEPA